MQPTNLDDFIDYLRAYRICNEGFLEEEIGYVIAAFLRLGYPKGLILSLRR